MKVIYVDLDTVLNDLEQAWLDFCIKRTGLYFGKEHITNWKWFFETFGDDIAGDFFNSNFYDAIKPRENARQFLKDLKALGYEPVIISSFVNNAGVEEQYKKDWILEHLGVYTLIVTRDKQMFTKNYILIDDNIANCMKHIFANGTAAILFNPGDELPYAKPMPTERFGGLLKYHITYDGILSELKKS